MGCTNSKSIFCPTPSEQMELEFDDIGNLACQASEDSDSMLHDDSYPRSLSLSSHDDFLSMMNISPLLISPIGEMDHQSSIAVAEDESTNTDSEKILQKYKSMVESCLTESNFINIEALGWARNYYVLSCESNKKEEENYAISILEKIYFEVFGANITKDELDEIYLDAKSEQLESDDKCLEAMVKLEIRMIEMNRDYFRRNYEKQEGEIEKFDGLGEHKKKVDNMKIPSFSSTSSKKEINDAPSISHSSQRPSRRLADIRMQLPNLKMPRKS